MPMSQTVRTQYLDMLLSGYRYRVRDDVIEFNVTRYKTRWIPLTKELFMFEFTYCIDRGETDE